MKIFISYRRAEEKKSYIVRIIHQKLAGVFGRDEVFRDTQNIAGGDNWREVLGREINQCLVMLVIIGPEWAGLSDAEGKKRLDNPNDVTRWEVETGLLRYAQGQATVIPVLVLDAKMPGVADLPESLHPLAAIQWVRLREDKDLDGDLNTLVENIKSSKAITRDGTPGHEFEPETVYIDAGPFTMGNQTGKGYPSYEEGLFELNLPAYRIGLTPITNALLKFYYDFHKKDPDIFPPQELGWDGLNVPDDMRELPVAGITWFEAKQYCEWLSQETGHEYSLPTEAQWEKACRSGKDYLYPWGNENDGKPPRSNLGNGKIAKVRAFPPQNDFGLYDLVGNVRQWTRTIWGVHHQFPDKLSAYPWGDDKESDKRRNEPIPDGDMRRVFRGCSYIDSETSLRSGARGRERPGVRGFQDKRYGFRVVRND